MEKDLAQKGAKLLFSNIGYLPTVLRTLSELKMDNQSNYGNKSHMTYLSILAWMITNYKRVSANLQYDFPLEGMEGYLKKRGISPDQLVIAPSDLIKKIR